MGSKAADAATPRSLPDDLAAPPVKLEAESPSALDANTRHRHSVSGEQEDPGQHVSGPVMDSESGAEDWGSRLQAITSELLDLMGEFSSQGSGTPRREITRAAQLLEDASRAVDSAKIVMTGVMDTEHVAAVPLGGTFGWEPEPEHPQFKDLADFMVQTLRISRTQAKQRIALAKAIRPREQFSNGRGTAHHPHLADAVEHGELSTDAAHITLTTSDHIAAHAPTRCEIGDVQTDAEKWADEAERTLCTQAHTFGPDQLRRIAKHFEVLANQDGAEPTERELAQKQGLFYKKYRNKLHHLELVVTDFQYEALSTFVNALITPTRDGKIHLGSLGTTVTGSASSGDSASGEAGMLAKSDVAREILDIDPLKLISGYGVEPSKAQVDRASEGLEPTYAQKLLDAFLIAAREGAIALAEAVKSEDGAPNYVPKARQTVIAVINQHDLTGALKNRSEDSAGTPAEEVPGAGTTTDPPPHVESDSQTSSGTAFYQRIGAATSQDIRRVACNADLIPVVFGGDSQPLDVGRSRRLFTAAQRVALNARDKGCVFPGCTTPLAFCEAHHINPWSRGGETNLSNGVLLCSYHHHYIHTGTWEIAIIDNTPWLIPPLWVDSQQRPLRNTVHTFGTSLRR